MIKHTENSDLLDSNVGSAKRIAKNRYTARGGGCVGYDPGHQGIQHSERTNGAALYIVIVLDITGEALAQQLYNAHKPAFIPAPDVRAGLPVRVRVYEDGSRGEYLDGSFT